MSNTDLDLLKAILEAKLAAIATASDKRADIVIQQAPDALDQTQYAAERDLTVSLLNRDSEMSRRLRGALHRLQDGTYGICLACEEQISVKRLRAVPWAELCFRCQEKSDVAARGVLSPERDETAELEIA